MLFTQPSPLLATAAEQVSMLFTQKHLLERSSVCHNHKPQPTPDTKKKRKKGQKHTRAKQTNKCTRSTKTSSVFPKRGNQNANTNEKTKTKSTRRHSVPCGINHKATQNSEQHRDHRLRTVSSINYRGLKILLTVDSPVSY